MKKALIISMFCFFTLSSFAQVDTNKLSNSMGMNVISLVNLTFKLQYEKMFNDNKRSIVAVGGVTLYTDQISRLQGIHGEVQYRFNTYVPNMGAEHAYIYFAPFAGASYISVDTKDISKVWGLNTEENSGIINNTSVTPLKESYSSLTAGCIFGSKFAPFGNFFLDVNIGGGFRYSLDNAPTMINVGTLSLGYSGVYPRANITIGVDF